MTGENPLEHTADAAGGAHRIPHYGLIDRTSTVDFAFDGVPYTGHPGDTLASALLANGVHTVARSPKLDRPRGVLSAGVEEPNALVQIDEPFAEPMLPASTVQLCDGLVAHGLAGYGHLPEEPDTQRYDAKHAHADLLVIGAGPAGLSAARTAAASGADVLVVDDQPNPGGYLLGSAEKLADQPAAQWARDVVDELAASGQVTILERTSAFGLYDDGFVLALQRRTDHLGAWAPAHLSRHRVWRIRASEIILATGGHERPYAFANNDRPGVLLAGAARTYLHRYGVRVGSRAVVATTNDSAYAAAIDLADAGTTIAAIADARDRPPAGWAAACAARGIEVRPGEVIAAATGQCRVTESVLAARSGAETTRLACDVVLVSGGWNPAVQLFSHARGTVTYSAELAAFVPETQLPHIQVAGAAGGCVDTDDCLMAGRDAATVLGFGGERADTLPPSDARPTEQLPSALWSLPPESDAVDTRFVDLARDATVSDIHQAINAGLRSVEHVKRYTTIGTAHDQGKTSGIIASGIVADALGVELADVGSTSFRPPYTPVPLATIVGRDRGQLYDPVRVTALHSWHVAHGAEFENVGQWKRPWYYPRAGEDIDHAVQRECRAARQGVALMDGSTLGKIDVQGPDAAEFLNLLYTNMIATLKVGRIRYGVMCGVDGMVFDDGTVTRIADDHFLVTTTTGNAAPVLDWMEEWLQTQWRHFRVSATSVTDHWVTIPLVGPQSRAVLDAVAPDLDCSADAFGFMTWTDTTVAGVPARVCRISFSGELAYEINVRAWDGLAVWEALIEAGGPYDITPYGTETMHVLRAEKGFPIIGQDTDGTVTPQDLGMFWAVSKKKHDFIGKRSFDRADNRRPDRKHLVGLLPGDARQPLPEGAQVVDTDQLPEPPVPMLGQVTSSYHSAALETTFALALVSSGRERIGQTLRVPTDSGLTSVTVTEPVLYDREGARRDG